MNLFSNTLIIFIIIFSIIYLKNPIIKNDDPILNKIYLFAGIFALEILLLSVTRVNKDCKEEECKNIFKESVKFALFSVIGYSIFLDLIIFPKYNIKIDQNDKMAPFYISGIISSFILVAKYIDNIVDKF